MKKSVAVCLGRTALFQQVDHSGLQPFKCRNMFVAAEGFCSFVAVKSDGAPFTANVPYFKFKLPGDHEIF